MNETISNILKKLVGCQEETIQIELDKKIKDNINLAIKNGELTDQIANLTKSKNPMEDHYNNKYPKKNMVYLRHETDGDYKIDVRNFFQLEDHKIPVVNGETDDDKALNAVDWVIKNIKYVSDKSEETYKQTEYWAYPYQTLFHGQGDCEDGAILLANIMVKSGIPYWKVRVTAGTVKGGGHAFVTYYHEEKDRWVVLDWCYWPNKLKIEERKDYKEETNYYDVWFSFNKLYAFSTGTKSEVSS